MSEAVESTATLTFSRPCTLCGGIIDVIMGERQRHVCQISWEADDE